MNRLYKSFFSKQLGRFVVTSEKARTKTKSSKTTTVAAAVVTTLGITFSAGALANSDIVPNANEIVGSTNTVISDGEIGNIVVGKYNGVSGSDNNVIGINNKSWDIFSEEANEDENSAVFDFFTLNNSDGEPTDGNNIFGAENYYRGYGNVITGQSNLVTGSENDTVGTSNQIAGNRNATFGQSNTTSGYQTVNVGLNNSVDQAHRANIFGNTNDSINDKTTTVIGERNETRGNAESFVAGTNNELGGLYGTNVVGLNNNVFSAPLPEAVDFYDPRNPGYWVGIDVEGYEVPVQFFYPSGKTNVFGADNNIASSYTTVVGNNNRGQNASNRAETRMAMASSYMLDNWQFEDIVRNQYGYSNADNSVVSGNDNVFGGNTSIHGLSNNAYGTGHNLTGSNNTTFGENNNIHGSGNLVGEIEHTNDAYQGERFNSTTGQWEPMYGWGPTGVSEAYNNNIVGSQNHVVGDDNSVIGNNNRSQYTTQEFINFPDNQPQLMSMLSGVNVQEAIYGMGGQGYEQFNERTYESSVVGFGNTFGTASNILGSYNDAYGYSNTTVGNENQLAGSYTNVVGSNNFTGGQYNESEYVYDPIGGYYYEVVKENLYASENLSVTGNNNFVIGMGHNVTGNSNITIDGPKSDSVYNHFEGGVKLSDFITNHESYFEEIPELNYVGGIFSNVSGNNNTFGSLANIVGNSNLADGFAIGSLGNFNAILGDNTSVVGNANNVEAERSTVIGNNNWSGLQLVGRDESGEPIVDADMAEQYLSGLETTESFDLESAVGMMANSAYDTISDSNIMGSNNIALGNKLLITGQKNFVIGEKSSVVGHQNILDDFNTSSVQGNNNSTSNAFDQNVVGNYNTTSFTDLTSIIGSQNRVDNAYALSLLGFANTLDQIDMTSIIGYANDLGNLNRVSVIGSSNDIYDVLQSNIFADSTRVSNSEMSTVIGSSQAVNNAQNSLIISNASQVSDITKSTVLGHTSNYENAENITVIGNNQIISDAEFAVVLGNNNNASVDQEITNRNSEYWNLVGSNNSLTGAISYSSAVGNNNQLSANNSTLLGNGNVIESGSLDSTNNLISNALAVGNYNSIEISNAKVFGDNNTINEISLGETGKQYQTNLIALGSSNTLSYDYSNSENSPYITSSVLGQMNSVTNISGAHIQGSQNTIFDRNGSDALNEQNHVGIFGSQNSVETDVQKDQTNLLSVVGSRNEVTNANNSLILGNENNINGNSNISIGNNNTITETHSISVGSNITNNGGIVFGNNSQATVGNIAFGDNAVANGASLGNQAFYVGGTSKFELAIGNDGENRRITGVAAGSNPYDAVNVEQLKAVVNDLGSTGNVKYKEILDADGKPVLDAQGQKTYDFTTVVLANDTTIAADTKYKDVQVVTSGGTVIDNVANATEADHAVNKGQLDLEIAGVKDGLDGTVKYARDSEGKIDFTNVILANEALKGTDANGIDYVQSGGSTINNVATATEYHQAINKGQFDQGLDALRNGAVMYALNVDGSVNKNLVNLAGAETTISSSNKYNVAVVTSGGTVLNNVANATEADHAVNKGQLDFAIAGVTDGINGAVKYERDVDGNINFDKAVLEGTQTVIAADDKYKDVQVVKSGGTVIDNVANATEADHAVNKGQMDVAIAGVQDGLDGTVKYGRDSEGKIDFTNVILATETVKGTDANGTDYVKSGGSTINNVATATEYHQAINKGQFDQGLDALRDGAVMYALNGDGTVNKGLVNLAGVETTISSSNKYNVAVVTSGGTVLNNVANATEADHAVNKGQMDFAIAGVADGINGAVKYERDAEGNINFDKAVLEGTQTVIAADAKYKDVQVVTSGGTVIDNVANATEADHAVNKGQMDVAIAGVQDGLDGAVKYGRDGEGKIDFTNVILATETVKGTDANGTDYVKSGGSTINNVATATEYHQAINKGQFDQGLDGIRNGAVMYALNVDGSVNKDIVNLMGTPVVAGESYGVQVAVSGGTVINNVAKATEFHQAINKGQLDEAIAQVYLENDGASVKYDVANGGIDYKNVTLKNDVVAGTDQYGVEVVASGGTNINNVATATQYHQAVNKGQMDSEFAKRDDLIAGAVQYDRNSDNSINYDQVTFAGEKAATGVNELGVEVVTSGGTVLANVGNATEAHHAINKGMFDDAIARLEAETEGTVKYDKNTDGTIDYSNITLAGETAVVEKNADGVDVVTSGGTTINNVATATEAHQAINKGQFDEALSKIEGESAGNVKYDKNADGSVDYNNVSYAGDKAVVEKNDLGIDVVTSGGTTLKNIANATQADEAINKGQFDDGLARLQDGTVQYARNEDGSVNKNSVVMGGDKAVIAKNEAGIEVVKSGGTVISNVAVATQADHAINKGQFDEGLHQARDYADQGDISTLHNANNYTDNRVNALWSEFQDESKDLRAGIAGAMAVGNLPQPSEAGYSMFSMGVATYKGQQAIAMGLSAVTEDKRYIFKIAATTTSRNDTGGAASVGMQWK